MMLRWGRRDYRVAPWSVVLWALALLTGQAGAQSLLWQVPIYGLQPSAHDIGSYFKRSPAKTQGDRVAVPVRRSFGGYDYASVTVVDASTGALVWRTDIPPPCNLLSEYLLPSGIDLAFAQNGDLVVAVAAGGFDYPSPNQPKIGCVVRLDGVDGHVQWLRRFDPANFQTGKRGFLSIALDANQDVIAAGYASEEAWRSDGYVVKLSGLDGQPLWTYIDQAPDGASSKSIATDVAVAGDGAVFVATYRETLRDTHPAGTARLLKIDPTGSGAWTIDRDAYGLASVSRHLSVRDDGTVLWAGTFFPGFDMAAHVSLLRASTGAYVWTRRLSADRVRAVASTRSGDIYVAGFDDLRPIGQRNALARISPADGADIWQVALEQPQLSEPLEFANLAVTDAGDIVAEIIDKRHNNGALATPYRFVAGYDRNGGSERWRSALPDSSVRQRSAFLTVLSGRGAVISGALYCWDGATPCGLRFDRLDAHTGEHRLRAVEPQLADTPVLDVSNWWDQYLPWNLRQTAVWSAGAQPGPVVIGESNTQLNVVKVSADSGEPIWKVGRRDTFGAAFATELAATPTGDVLVCAFAGASGFATLKLSGVDGHELWRATEEYPDLAQVSLAPSSVVADLQGNVLLAVGLAGDAVEVVKYDGNSGQTRWRRRLVNAGSSVHVHADGAGHAIVTSMVADGALVTKLDAAQGTVRWTRRLPGAHLTINATAITGNGDVLVAGDQEGEAYTHRAFARRLRGADGAVLWAVDNLPSAGPHSYVTAALLTAQDDFFVGAASGQDCWALGCSGESSWVVSRLDAATGQLRWTSNVLPLETVERVTVLTMGQGTLLAAGPCKAKAHCVVGLSPADGDVLWSLGYGSTRGLAPAASYPRLIAYAGSGELLIAGNMSFPSGEGQYHGWRVGKAKVPVVNEIFASGFE